MRNTDARRAPVLGEGRESTVYAVHLKTSSASVACALRVPHRETKNTTRPARLAAILGMPPHAHVVAVLGGMHWRGCEQCVLLLERIHGVTLHDVLAVCAWSAGEALAAGRHVVAGLAHMHRHALRHGDVNLHNILVQGRACKLTDYFAEPAHGAPAYMAPEVVRGSAALVSDVWSAACVLLALHGQHPFDGLEVPAVLWKLGNDFPPGNLPPSALADLLQDVFVPAQDRPAATHVLQRLDVITRDARRDAGATGTAGRRS